MEGMKRRLEGLEKTVEEWQERGGWGYRKRE